MGGACVYHGVYAVQVAGLSPLHAEQALSWEYFVSVGGFLGNGLLLRLVANCLPRCFVRNRKSNAARVFAVDRGMAEQVYTTWDHSKGFIVLLWS